MNNIMLVGRLAHNIEEINEKDYFGKKASKMTLAINRSYKDVDDIYQTDFVDIILWDGVASSVKDYCQKGDIIGVRGRIETRYFEDKKNIVIIGDKVTFLSSKPIEEEK